MDRLRPFVGLEGWDYCVIWKLSEDQRFIEWMNCCCGGTENIQNDHGEQEPSVSQVLPCRDTMFHHPRTKSCDLLAQLPSSMTLDSGIYAKTMISNQPSWLNFNPTGSDSSVPDEPVGTKVLIPFPGGLIELFASKQIPEDEQVMHYITSQCNISVENNSLTNAASNMDSTFNTGNVNPVNEIQPKLCNIGSGQMDANNNFHPPFSPSTAFDSLNLTYDIPPADRTRPCSSPMYFLQQFSYNSEDRTKDDLIFKCSHDSMLSNKKMDAYDNSSRLQENEMHKSMMTDVQNNHVQHSEPIDNNKEKQRNEKDSIKRKCVRSDSLSDCSDQIDDEDDGKYRRRAGKGKCKNLVAERKRRKKINERLYTLRSLVPKISKLDRASILGDAIEFVKELQKQAKELQDELEIHSDNNGAKNTFIDGYHNNSLTGILFHNGANDLRPKPDHDKAPNELHMGMSGTGSNSKQNQDSDAQQMEPHVEVAQIDSNEFFVTVTCEHKPGGFVRLMEALNSLGLEVTNANVTTFRTLVSNVFKVEKEDNEIVQADHVRDSLLDLTRNPLRDCSEMSKASENDSGMDYQHHLHHLHFLSKF